MTGAPIPHPARPGDQRQKGTPVADDRVPHALPDRANDNAAPEPAVSVWSTSRTGSTSPKRTSHSRRTHSAELTTRR